jgi:hypothetical protein
VPILRVRQLIFLGITLAALIAVGIWIAADGEQGESQNVRARSQPREPQQWEQLVNEGRQEAESSLLGPWPFAEVRRVEGGMPGPLRKDALELLGEPTALGLRFAKARYATTPNNLGLWVVPGNGVICMFRAAKLASSCKTIVQVYRHGIVLQTYKWDRGGGEDKPTAFASFGIVPDGIRRVPVKIGDRWTTVGVVDNTFFIGSRQTIGIPGGLKRPTQ